tara:strand:- start:1034 stop:2005 length:972 start_codon:yes stop_codon:yes gene_type:complete
MITKGLIVITTQGFGNRLKILASSHILSAYLKLPLYVCWEASTECKINLSDTFNLSVKIKEIKLDDFKDSKYCFFGRVHTNSVFDNIMDVYNDKDNEFEYLLIEGGHEFKHNSISRLQFIQDKQDFYSKLEFSDLINNKFNNFISEIGKKYIAIHYRDINEKFDRLDIDNNSVVDFTNNSPIDKFFEIINKIKINIPIVIISNTKKFFNHFIEKYGKMKNFKNSIYTTGIEYCERENKDDMISSIVDFKILASSELIIGNYFSSFSDEASFFKLVPKITPLSNKLIENIQTTVNNYHCLNYSFIDNIAALNFNDRTFIKYLQI